MGMYRFPCVSTQALDLLLHRNSPGVWGKLLETR